MDIATRQSILDQIIAACEGAQYANRDAWWAKAAADTLLGAVALDLAALSAAVTNASGAAGRARVCATTAFTLFGQIPETASTDAEHALTGRAHDWTCYAVSEAARADQYARTAADRVAKAVRAAQSTTVA